MLADLRSAARALRHNPLFTATAVLTLALGLGATTAIYSLLDAMLLRVLKFPDPDRIVYLSGITAPPSGSTLEHFRQARSIELLSQYVAGRATLVVRNESRVVTVARVSRTLFALAGATPRTGATFVEESESAVPPALLSEALARSTFTDPAAAIGQQVGVSDLPHVVIGVMRPGFDFPWRTDVWLQSFDDGLPPVVQVSSLASLAGAPGGLTQGSIARLRNGVPREQAEAEIRVLQRQAEDAVQRSRPNVRMGRSEASVPLLREVVVRRHALLLGILPTWCAWSCDSPSFRLSRAQDLALSGRSSRRRPCAPCCSASSPAIRRCSPPPRRP